MKIDDLYISEITEDLTKSDINKVASFIRKDGFNISGFSLNSIDNYTWEFLKDSDRNRGFQIFYNSKVCEKPAAEYLLGCGSVFFSFEARNITEAYIQHNRQIDEADYELLSRFCPAAEKRQKQRAKHYKNKYGIEAACDFCNCTTEWLRKI